MRRELRFRTSVWQADVDAFGELRSSALLRFLQETATRASTDAGFDPAYYERQGTLWLVRRTMLNVLAPMRYGDELEARTWVADFRRVRSRRDYEVRVAGTLVVRASTDWVYVERLAGRPRRVPPEMQAALGADGAVALARPSFPEEAAPPGAARSTRRVQLHDLDALRHVNNAAYASWVEQAAADADRELGWDFADERAAGGRFRAVAHDIEYLDAAVYGEEIALLTWPRTVFADAIERHTLLVRGGAERPLLRAASRYAWVDEAGAPRRLPIALRTALEEAAG